MKKNKHSKKKSKPKESFNLSKFPANQHDLELLITFWLNDNPEEFVKYLKEDPESILDNIYIQTAIRLLRKWCITAPSDGAKESRKLLKAIGLSGLIPKNLPKRKTNNVMLLIFQENQVGFLKLVEKYRQIIGVVMKKGKSTRREKVSKLFEYFCNNIFSHKENLKEIPKGFFIGERTHDNTMIAISFIAYEFAIPFFSLRKFYRSLPQFT